MLIAVLAIVALAWWLHRDGLLLPNLVRLGGAAAVGLLAFRLLTSGRVVAAALVAGAGWAWWQWQKRRPAGIAAEVADAARLLGVAPDAPIDVVWQAWRQAMTSAHPDAGGSDAAASRLTAARDLLITRAGKRDPERS